MTTRVAVGNRRRASLGRCPSCKAPILAGPDDHGLPTRTDPRPLTRAAELQLFLAHRPTYEIDHGDLVYRDRWRIRRPATGGVVAEHRCTEPLEPHHLAPVPPYAAPVDHQTPPF